MGGTHGDATRLEEGTLRFAGMYSANAAGNTAATGTGIFTTDLPVGGVYFVSGQLAASINSRGVYSNARVTPTANKIAPRAWGSLACVYLGQPSL